MKKGRSKKVVENRQRNAGKHGVPVSESVSDDAVFMTPSQFLRWLPTQGLTLSRKSLYKTYFGKGARHPVHTSPDGKRIHKHKALELIRIVQGGGTGADESARMVAERQLADARYRTAKARMAELELEEQLGARVPFAVLEQVWAAMWENVKNEARTAAHNLPDELHGKTKSEMRASLELAFHRIFSHLASDCRQRIVEKVAAKKVA